MKVKAMEIVGLTLGDIMAFLFIAIAFLYTQTEPLTQTRRTQLTQETIERQRERIETLSNQVKVLEKRLAGTEETNSRQEGGEQIYVRLFPGDVLVVMEAGEEPARFDGEGLIEWLKKRMGRDGRQGEVVISGERGVGYEETTRLAERIMKEAGLEVNFGW